MNLKTKIFIRAKIFFITNMLNQMEIGSYSIEQLIFSLKCDRESMIKLQNKYK